MPGRFAGETDIRETLFNTRLEVRQASEWSSRLWEVHSSPLQGITKRRQNIFWLVGHLEVASERIRSVRSDHQRCGYRMRLPCVTSYRSSSATAQPRLWASRG